MFKKALTAPYRMAVNRERLEAGRTLGKQWK
jgi:hypothetical protein